MAPALVMPSLTASVAEVETAGLLMRFQVPGWALAPGCGREARSGYRLEPGLGRFSVVGTTGKAPERLPHDVVADEKHSRWDGAKLYLATTAGEGGLLGASGADSAAAAAGRPADGVFAEAARAVEADSTPETVNSDGGAATHGAGKRFCPSITVLRGVLHAVLTIRDRAPTALAECVEPVGKTVWRADRAPGKAAVAQRRRRRREGAERTLPDSPMTHPPLDRGEQRAPFSRSDDHAQAHRPRNRVDRLIKCLDRACVNAPDFHGTVASAEFRVRALAWLWNCCPSSPGTVKKDHGRRCPAERLNGQRYADNGLENWLVSGSLNGLRRYQQNPL